MTARFTVPFLTPGSYAVRAELQGFKPIDQSGVQVRLGQTVEIAADDAGRRAAGNRFRSRPRRQPSTPRAPRSAPTSTAARFRACPSAVVSATRCISRPASARGGSVGIANPSVEGSSGLENQYVVDGVNITNGGYGALGSYSIVFGSLGNGTPYDFMQEVQVKTGGYEAEFGQATGGVINVVTKSGSNDAQGQRVRLRAPEQLRIRATTPCRASKAPSTPLHRRLSDVGATVGGPVVTQPPVLLRRDRSAVADEHVHRAGGISARRRSARSTVTAASTNYAARAPGRRRAHTASTRRSSAIRRTATMGPQRSSSLLKQTTSGYSSLGVRRPQPDRPLRRRPELAFPRRGVVRPCAQPHPGDAVGQRLAGHRLPRHADASISGGLGFYEAGNRSNNWQIQAKATNILAGYRRASGALRLRLRAPRLQPADCSTRVRRSRRRTASRRPRAPIVDIIPDPVFGQIYHVSRASLTAARPTTQNYSAFFVEDEWKIGNSLTIRPGVRYEQETLSGTLVQEFSLKNNWAPRVGVVWDPTRSGTRQGVRQLRPLLRPRAERSGGSRAVVRRIAHGRLLRCEPDEAGARTAPSTTNAVTGASDDDALHAARRRRRRHRSEREAELLQRVGRRRGVHAVPHGLDVGVRYVHRDIGRVLEDVQPYPIVATSLGLPGAATANYLLTNPGPGHARRPGHSRRDGQLRIAGSQLQRRRVHGEQAASANQLVAGLVVSLVAADREFRGVLPQRQRSVGSGHLVALRLSDRTTRHTRRSACRSSATPATSGILGSAGNGPLPLDRTHDIKAYGTYAFDDRAERLARAGSGVRRAADGASPRTRSTTAAARFR